MDKTNSKSIILVCTTYILPLLVNYSDCFPSQGRLSLAEYPQYYYLEPQGRGTYAFGYDIDDPETDNVQFRDEEKHPNGTVSGRYGYVTPDGDVFIVSYVADENGYRAKIEPPNRRLRAPRPETLDVLVTDNFLPANTAQRSSDRYPSNEYADYSTDDRNSKGTELSPKDSYNEQNVVARTATLVNYVDIEPYRFIVNKNIY